MDPLVHVGSRSRWCDGFQSFVDGGVYVQFVGVSAKTGTLMPVLWFQALLLVEAQGQKLGVDVAFDDDERMFFIEKIFEGHLLCKFVRAHVGLMWV
eukprot:6482267-Amphidinium_carterae.1